MAEELASSNALAEKDKILLYLAEAARLWAVNPELVISKEFFQLWQQTYQPRPFAVVEQPLCFGDLAVDVYIDTEQLGWFDWDSEEACAVLRVEGKSGQQKVLFTFVDGQPLVTELEPQWFEEDEMSLGERLEIIYDVIAEVHRLNPHLNVLDLPRGEYERAMTVLEPRYDKRAITVMRRLKPSFRNRLIRKAAEDMAVDELSQQLTLPLDGNYAMNSGSATGGGEPPVLPANQRVVLPGRTPWAVWCDLDLLSACARATEAVERTVVVDLRQAEVLGQGSNSKGSYASVRVPVPADLSLREGDRLPVLAKGEREPVAQLMIDVVDRDSVYGRLEWDSQMMLDVNNTPLVARPRQTATKFQTMLLEHMQGQLLSGDGSLSTAVLAALGMQDSSFELGSTDTPPARLDSSQVRAWRAAVAPDNAVVLIQGPPGTGKTSVLEAVLRTFCQQGQRVLVTTPSNTAVDNVCRRVADLPVLRFGWLRESIAPDVRELCWAEDLAHVQAFADKRRAMRCGGVFAGTPVGLLRNQIIQDDIQKNGRYDVIVFDEAGMARLDEFLLVANLGARAVLFGDHQQLPPFQMFEQVRQQLLESYACITRGQWLALRRSALEWLQEQRQFPLMLLQRSYRCQNPRLMRFASTLFYDARIQASEQAEYYRLNYSERQKKYPPSTLRLLSTSTLPLAQRGEKLLVKGARPGLENPLEAGLCVAIIQELRQRHPLLELTVITPYKCQVQLIRRLLRNALDDVPEPELRQFIHTRVATVDSFQGGESDAVVISYVRSSDSGQIGFVDDLNRINVAHTRCRREMVVIADVECLKRQARSDVFVRMERAMQRDGQVIMVDDAWATTALAAGR